MVCAPEDGHGQRVRPVLGARRVTSHEGDAVRGACLADAREDRLDVRGTGVKVHVEDGERVAAHRGDVAHVDHDRAPPGEVRVAVEQRRKDPLGGEQEVAGPVGDRGGVVADENAPVAGLPSRRDGRGRVEARGHASDVALGPERGAAGKLCDAVFQVHAAVHRAHAAPPP